VARFKIVHDDRRFADNRARRRDRSGTEAGATAGALIGLVLGSLVPGVGSLAGLALAVAVGAAAGAAAGRVAVTQASVDDWDRSPSERPYVGAHTPDPDGDGSEARGA